jgi:hypothetical protein
MKVGDVVKADSWLENIGGKLGVITFVQDVKHCISARVLFETGVALIRLDNLRLVNESR